MFTYTCGAYTVYIYCTYLYDVYNVHNVIDIGYTYTLCALHCRLILSTRWRPSRTSLSSLQETILYRQERPRYQFLPSIPNACRPNKPSVQNFHWCGNGITQKLWCGYKLHLHHALLSCLELCLGRILGMHIIHVHVHVHVCTLHYTCS